MPGYLSVGLNMCVQLPDRKYNKVQILKIDVVIKLKMKTFNIAAYNLCFESNHIRLLIQ